MPIPVDADSVTALPCIFAVASLVTSLMLPAVAVMDAVFAVPPVPLLMLPMAMLPWVAVMSIAPLLVSTDVYVLVPLPLVAVRVMSPKVVASAKVTATPPLSASSRLRAMPPVDVVAEVTVATSTSKELVVPIPVCADRVTALPCIFAVASLTLSLMEPPAVMSTVPVPAFTNTMLTSSASVKLMVESVADRLIESTSVVAVSSVIAPAPAPALVVSMIRDPAVISEPTPSVTVPPAVMDTVPAPASMSCPDEPIIRLFASFIDILPPPAPVIVAQASVPISVSISRAPPMLLLAST